MTDDQLKPPAGGLYLNEALERYCDPNKWKRYQSLGSEIDWNTRYIMSRVGGLTESEKLRARKVSDFQKAQADLSSDLYSKLRSGDLVAWARDGSPIGPWRDIPSDSWITLSVHSLEKSILSGPDNLKLFSVRIYEAAQIERDEDTARDGQSTAQELDKTLRPPKGRRGRKPIWDWEAAEDEFTNLSNIRGGLPHPQAQVEKHMAQWFVNKFGDQPSESMIRQFVAKRLPPDYRGR